MNVITDLLANLIYRIYTQAENRFTGTFKMNCKIISQGTPETNFGIGPCQNDIAGVFELPVRFVMKNSKNTNMIVQNLRMVIFDREGNQTTMLPVTRRELHDKKISIDYSYNFTIEAHKLLETTCIFSQPVMPFMFKTNISFKVFFEDERGKTKYGDFFSMICLTDNVKNVNTDTDYEIKFKNWRKND